MHSDENTVSLSEFDNRKGLNREKGRFTEMVWYLFKIVFFLSAIPWPSKLKAFILILFGAKVGKGLVMKPRVNIHFPWKLELGKYVWLGEEVFILNFEKITIEDNVCISQRAFLCGGNHDYKAKDFRYKNGPIYLENGSWVGAQCFVAPNVRLGKNSVLTAGSVATKDLPANMICKGNPAEPIKDRW